MPNKIKSSLLSLLSFCKKYFSKDNLKEYAGPIIIAVLTIFIPLLIGICHSQFVKGSQQSAPIDISVSLYASDGTLIGKETTQEDIVDASRLVNLFHTLTFSKVRAQKPTEFNEKPNMSYTIAYGSEPTTFKCYFDEDVTSSYIEDQNGSFFSPDAFAYSLFLASAYSETIYKESTPPTLFSSLNEKIIPSQAEWTYDLKDGTKKISNNYKITEEILTYRIEGAISFEFSRTPEVFAITIKAPSGETIFSGAPEDLDTLNVAENTELLVSINAKWIADEIFTSYGDQHYDFKIICSKPPTFNISKTDATGGQILFLSISNIYGVDTIYYSPTSSLNIDEYDDKSAQALKELYSYTPIFVREGPYAYAILPIPANIPDTEFSFSLSCGIAREIIALKITKSTSANATPSDALLTEAQKAEFSRILFHLKHSKSDVLLLNEDFIFPDSYGFTLTQKYNDNINNSFTLLANSYTSSSQIGTSVRSANLGIVSDVGFSPLLGNYVMVDHGMGILTWYCGLSDVSVRENDIVKKGDIIGRAGSSSLLCDNGVNIICSVGGILINPNELAANN